MWWWRREERSLSRQVCSQRCYHWPLQAYVRLACKQEAKMYFIEVLQAKARLPAVFRWVIAYKRSLLLSSCL
ncbi:hypothetical protein [Aneurinibacillus soli]|uniref:hypothetical protein n=1 Tax=Aneurinibacillus soli TaxID=1500254 RepID=UPI0011B7F909|nr:hypothetical protein [Aneurinibacillus soli]